jgi:hypothetical protein
MPTGGLDVQRVDKFGIQLELKKFKTERGDINYPVLFSIPKDERIAAMAEKDLEGTMKTITVAITLALETMNLSRPMQSFQILDLAEAVVDSAGEEDKPSLPDFMLFLQKLTRGEYPGLYEGIDIPKFMERWNKYRDERWEAGIELRDKQHEYYKSLGGSREAKKMDSFDSMLFEYSNKLQAKKDEVEALKAENKRLRK